MGPQGTNFQMGMPGGSNTIYLSKQQASGSSNISIAGSPHPSPSVQAPSMHVT